MPGMNSKMLYPDISSVNTFRVILDDYFGTNYELLDDRSFYSTLDHPFKLIDITNRLGDPNIPDNLANQPAQP
jgi:hypothetical protein